MATIEKIYLNGIETIPPLNWQQLEIELNYDKDKQEAKGRIALTDLEFVNEAADVVNKWRTGGLTNGPGVFEGLPLQIEVKRGSVTETPFSGYLDLSQGAIFSKDKCVVKAVDVSGIDSFTDKCDSFTFEHLYGIGQITSADFVWIPYIINSVPNYVEAAVAVLGVYVMAKEIRDVIEKIAEFVPELPLYYVFSTYIRLIIYIIYLIFLIIALVKLIKSIILLLIQPVKYHACMSLKEQLIKGASYLGMKFHSTILDEGPFNNTYIMPEKYYNQINTKDKQIFGFTDPSINQQGFYKGTYGDLIREAKKLWRSKILIKNETEIWLVREDYTDAVNQYTMPTDTSGTGIYMPNFRLNTDEFKSNTLISFLTDSIDKNTIQDYEGTSYQVIVEPQRINNQNMVLMKGLDEVRINFALAKRKETLTVPEDIMKNFLEVFQDIAGAMITAVNAVIDVLNTIIALVNDVIDKLGTIGIKLNFELPDIPTIEAPDFTSVFTNRIGMLKLENDIINVPKIFLADLGSAPKYHKISQGNQFQLSGRYLYDNFHFIASFVPSAAKPNGNQYVLKDFENVPFTFEDYLKVKNNNAIFTAEGEDALLDSLKWNIWQQKANMSIRINEKYTNNFKVSKYQPDGR